MSLTLSQCHAIACVHVANAKVVGEERARAILARAITVDPHCWSAYEPLITILWSRGHETDDRGPALAELARFRKAVLTPTSSPEGLIAFANTLFDHGRRRGAIAELKTSLTKSNPGNRPTLRTGVANLQVRMADFVDATQRRSRKVFYLKECLRFPEETDTRILNEAIVRLEREPVETIHFGSAGAFPGGPPPAGVQGPPGRMIGGQPGFLPSQRLSEELLSDR